MGEPARKPKRKGRKPLRVRHTMRLAMRPCPHRDTPKGVRCSDVFRDVVTRGKRIIAMTCYMAHHPVRGKYRELANG